MTHLGTLFEEARRRLGLRVVDVVRRAGYKNLSKGVRRFGEIERSSGLCPPEVLAPRFAEVLGVDEAAVRAAIALDAPSRPKVAHPAPMIGPPAPFSIEVRGQRVEGLVVYVCRNDISVEITQPYRGIHSGLHIPYFGMWDTERHFAREDGDPATISPNGWKTAREILGKLYVVSACVADHRDDLRAALQRIQADQEAIAEANMPSDALDPDAFREERRKLRARRTAGEIDERQYGKLMAEVHNQKRAYTAWARDCEREIEEGFRGFVSARYGVFLSFDVENQVLGQLRSRPGE